VVAACLGADSVDLVAVAVDQGDPVAAGSRRVASLMTWAMTSAASSTTLVVSHLCSALGGRVCWRAVGRVDPSRKPGIAALV
jgi:hypothetical protein